MGTSESFPFSILNNVLKGEKVPCENEDVNIGELILNVLKSQPNFVAQVDARTGKEITYQEIRNKSVKLAMWLISSGIRPGDEIIISSSHHAVMYAFFASLFIGAIPILWHEKHKFDTVRRIIHDNERKMLFIDDILATALFDDLIAKNPVPIVVVFGIFTVFLQYDDLESKNDAAYDQVVIDKFVCAQLNERQRNIATILYTRGTSRFCRPVSVSHRSFMAAVNWQVFDILPAGTGMWVGSFSSLTNVIFAIYLILSFKRTIRFTGYWKQEVCQTLEKYKVNWVLLETYMCRDIVNSNLLYTNDLSSLNMLIFTGSPISYDVHSKLMNSLPHTSIISLYSTTETGIISCQTANGKITSNGYVGKNIHVKIVEICKEEILGPYMCGEIFCKCDDIMNAYLYNFDDKVVELIDKNGWFNTRDIGFFDNDGAIFVLERMEDIILFNFRMISPTIIENMISRYSVVETVAVVAVSDNENYEHPVAFISLKPRTKLNEEELMNEIRNKLDNSMHLRGGVRMIVEMPYSLNGDIDRNQLRETAEEDKYFQLQNFRALGRLMRQYP